MPQKHVIIDVFTLMINNKYMNEYLPRIVDNELALRLESTGAVLIVGPKWSGKTTTAKQKAKSIIKLQDPDERIKYKNIVDVKPSLLLLGEKPRLIDEWQDIPELWDAVRTSVDEENQTGLYILTGSNSVDYSRIMHSGIGRISRMEMYPMSLFESKESNGKISLSSLFNEDNHDIDGITSDITIEELIFALCRGGWPGALSMKTQQAQLFVAKDYLDGIIESEISDLDGVKRDRTKTRALIRSLARNVSSLATKESILSDISKNTTTFSLSTLDSYLNALNRLFVIEDIPAWCPSIRSKSAIKASNKRSFIDPSIAVNALGVNPEYFYHDLMTFGLLFENLVARDLKVYAQALGGDLSYYRDRYGLEADFVLHLYDGRYALIECKLGTSSIEEGAQHLLKIKSLIEEKNKEEKKCPLILPSLMMVITGGKMAYKRKDGVFVIPIGCLRD